MFREIEDKTSIHALKKFVHLSIGSYKWMIANSHEIHKWLTIRELNHLRTLTEINKSTRVNSMSQQKCFMQPENKMSTSGIVIVAQIQNAYLRYIIEWMRESGTLYPAPFA